MVNYFMLFAIIFSAFLLGLYNVYWYFLSSVRDHVQISPHYYADNQTLTEAEGAFGT
jgi:hypothetical protein